MKRKRQPDVVMGEIHANNTKWITNSFIKGRRVTLRCVGLRLVQTGAKMAIDPVVFNMTQALRLLRKNKKLDDIIFTPGGFWAPTSLEGLRLLQPQRDMKTGMRYKG